MAFNQVENYFLARAIKRLKPKYEKVYGKYNRHFDIGNGIVFMVIESGPNKNKLTVAKSINDKLIPDTNIEPEDCYNLMLPGEDMYAAFQRVYRKEISND